MKVLILGGTRFIGPRLAEALLRAGASVTVLHRGETGQPVPGTRDVAGDRSLPDGLAGLGTERFDVVVDLSAYFSDWTILGSIVTFLPIVCSASRLARFNVLSEEEDKDGSFVGLPTTVTAGRLSSFVFIHYDRLKQ